MGNDDGFINCPQRSTCFLTVQTGMNNFTVVVNSGCHDGSFSYMCSHACCTNEVLSKINGETFIKSISLRTYLPYNDTAVGDDKGRTNLPVFFSALPLHSLACLIFLSNVLCRIRFNI